MNKKLELMFAELAVDGDSGAEDTQGTESTENTENTEESTKDTETETTEETATEDTKPIEFEVDGEKYTADQIKELKRAGLRQSDYTKKTQEISNQRTQNKEAIELYEYFKANPELAKKLAELDPTSLTKESVRKLGDPLTEKVNGLQQQLLTDKISRDLEAITSKDKDVSDLELLEIAQQNNCDINTAYNFYKGMNFDKILQKKLSEQSLNLTEKIKKEGIITKTVIKAGDKPAVKTATKLTPEQHEYAVKTGMTDEEYLHWS